MGRRPASGASKWCEWTSLVGDSMRLRLLRMLEREELGVGEMARVMQLPQSTVSRHLKALLDARWIARRNQGTTSLYRLETTALADGAADLWRLARGQVDPALGSADDARLAAVLADRRTDSRTFFGRVGGEWDALRRELFGTAFAVEALLSLLDPDATVADLGCGTGDVAEHLAPLVKRVIAVDREATMLDAARRRLAGHRNVTFRQGDLESLPIKSGEVDAAVLMLVLHHVDEPERAFAECGRVLAPRGRLLVVDMMRHDRQVYARTMGHRHLGFTESDGRGWARAGSLLLRRWRTLRPDASAKGPPLFAGLYERSG